MKRKDPYTYDPNMGFDMEGWEIEQGLRKPDDNYEDDGLKCYTVKACEVVVKYISVFASSSEEARDYVEDRLKGIDFEHSADQYIREVAEVTCSD